jgi:hypothetical protein
VAGGDGVGGSSALGQLILDGHGGPLRSDLQRYYGVDFVDLWRGTFSPRRVWQLSEYLPLDSALRAVLAGGIQFRDWNLQTQLLAHLLNVVRAADVNNVRVSGGKAKNPTPIDVPSPKGAKRKPRIDLSKHPLSQPISHEP